jgi:chromosome segregation ATPase
MSWNRRYSREPLGHTCPRVNNAQSEISGIVNDLESVDCSEEDKVILNDAITSLNSLSEDLENLRTDNSTLRDWGNEEAKKADDFEKELDETRDQLSEMETDRDHYKDRVAELEAELYDVERKFQNLEEKLESINI